MATQKEGSNFLPVKGKMWRGKITQATTAAPAVASVAENTLNLTNPTPARTSAGLYTFTFDTAVLTAGKTFAKVTSSKVTAVIPACIYTSTTVLTLQFFDAATPTAADSGDFDLEIFVYD
jgi:hypothetical protein